MKYKNKDNDTHTGQNGYLFFTWHKCTQKENGL